jgi:hypothetical protein
MALLNTAREYVIVHPFAVFFGLFAFYCLGLGVYRLYFHPLAKYPGPKLAAWTLWYEFYYDAIRCGQYTFKIQQMHHEYGKVSRS